MNITDLSSSGLVDQVEYWPAEIGSDLDDARRASRYRPLTEQSMNQGISGEAFWVRVRLTNDGSRAQSWYLVHRTSYLDHLEIYQRHTGEDAFEREHLSDRDPFAERSVDYRTLAYQSETPAEGQTELYLKVYYDEPDSVSLQFELFSPEEFATNQRRENLIFGAYYGALILLIVLATIIGLLLRRASVFSYAVLLASTAWMWLLFNGYGYQYLWPNSPYLQNEGFHLAFLCFALFATQFSKAFLRTRTRCPVGHRVLQTIQSVALVGIALRLSGFYLPVLYIAYGLFAAVALALPAISFHAWRNGLSYARWYCLAWVVYSLSVLLALASASLTIVPGGMAALGYLQIGSLLESLLLAVALTERLLSLETDRRQALDLANRDPLTGLGNRRMLQDEYARVRERYALNGTQAFLIMIDLDYFKEINDRFGHDAGDQVLKELARLLRQHCRGPDVCIRYGGEEFALLITADSEEGAHRLAERIRRQFAEQPTLYRDQVIHHTLSCGVTAVQQRLHSLSVNDMMRYADQALYEGKAAGRNQTVLYRDSDSDSAVDATTVN